LTPSGKVKPEQYFRFKLGIWVMVQTITNYQSKVVTGDIRAHPRIMFG